MKFVGAIHDLAPIPRGAQVMQTSLRLVLAALLAALAGCVSTPDVPVTEEAPVPTAPPAAAVAPDAAVPATPSAVTPAGELAATAMGLATPTGLAPAPQGQDPAATATPPVPEGAATPPADPAATPATEPKVDEKSADGAKVEAGKELGPTGPTKDHGGWVAPEILAAEQGVAGTPGAPGKVVFVAGRVAPYCRSVWRHRFEYGGYERYVEVNGFSSDAEAKDCAAKFKTANKPSWERMQANQHLVGKYFVVVSDQLLGERDKWESVRGWLEKNQPKKTSRIPKGVTPAGLQPGENFTADKGQPPPKGIKIRAGVKKYTPRGADVVTPTGPAPIPPPPAGTIPAK